MRQYRRNLVWAVILLTPPVARAAPVVVGGNEIIWVCQSVTDPQTGRLTWRFGCALADPVPPRWRPVPVDPITGDIRLWAVRGQNLHMFFSDGAHYRLSPPGRESTSGVDTPELRLPRDALPLAVAGDDPANGLWAVVPADIARELLERSRQATTQPATQSATTQPEAEFDAAYWLIRYVNGAWLATAPIPALESQPDWCRLAAYDNTCHLFFAADPNADAMQYARYDQQWNSGPAAPCPPSEHLAAFAAKDSVRLIAASRQAGGCRIRTIQLTNGVWTEGGVFRDKNGEIGAACDAIAAHQLGEYVAVVWADGERRTAAGLWPVEGGEPRSEPGPVATLIKPPISQRQQQINMLLGTFLVIVLVTVIFVRRRESLLVDFPPPPGFAQASLGRRFIAFIIDLFIVELIAFPAVLSPWVNAYVDSSQPILPQLDLAMALYADELYWRWLVAAGLFVLYAAAFEMTMAATPGKLIMQLRVCNQEGKRCSKPAIIVRNVARMIELYPMMAFAVTAILVVMTRNRQRVGDLLARTVVVEKIPSPPSEEPAQDSPDESDENEEKLDEREDETVRKN